ncbi:MAG TPA: hypothetical protein DCS48_11060 [Desulfovibrio sp.]|nr:hypothetical protein [Desulfovibrio sp.]
MQEELTKLFEVVSQLEKAELTVLNNAAVKTLSNYQADPTAKNKKDWDAAKKGLEEEINKLSKKHFSEQSETAEKFKNKSEVYRYLTEQGYKVSKSKVYNDKAGLLPNKDGEITLATVNNYIRSSGIKLKASSAQEKQTSVELMKSKLESEDAGKRKVLLQNIKLEMEIAEKKKDLIPADAVEFEHAKRCQLFKYALEAFGEKSADKISGIFGADEQVAARMLEQIGVDKSKAPELAAVIHAEQPAFISYFHASISSFLDVFSTETWMTEEMENLMKKWLERQEEEQVQIAIDLMAEANSGADPRTLLSMFTITRKAGLFH